MRDVLSRIAADGSQKVPVRFLPALRLERAAGRLPDGPVRGVAAWVLHLRGHGAPVRDPRADELQEAAAADDLRGAAAAVLGVVAPDLRDDDELLDAVASHAEAILAAAQG
jgi:fructuronate reductase